MPQTSRHVCRLLCDAPYSFIQLSRCSPTSIELLLRDLQSPEPASGHRGHRLTSSRRWRSGRKLHPSLSIDLSITVSFVASILGSQTNYIPDLRYALIETFFCLVLEQLLQLFSSLALAQKVVEFSYNSPTNSCGEPHLHVLNLHPAQF